MTDWMGYMKKLFWGEKASQQSLNMLNLTGLLYTQAGTSCMQFDIWIDIYAFTTLGGSIIKILLNQESRWDVLKIVLKKAEVKKQESEDWEVQNEQTKTKQLTKKDSH